VTRGDGPRSVRWLGALLVVYLAYPVGAFFYRVAVGHNEGWNVPGLWPALWVSVEGASISLMIGTVLGIPLAYVLAHRRGWLSSVIGVIVQLPLAVPPLICGILLIYLVGPYTFFGQLSGERLTETMYGLVIAQSFVSAPFLVVVARSAFHAVDPALGDVAATLGYGPVARFLRVEVPAASDGIRTGMILMWLRAFGEYGTTVVLAYHPYSLPVYVDNLFSSVPLTEAIAPTILAFVVAVVVVVIGRAPRRTRIRHNPLPTPVAPISTTPTPVGFDLDATVGTFKLKVAHASNGDRLAIVGPSGSGKTLTLRGLAGLLGASVGTVTFGGVDVGSVRTERRRLGYVPQGYGLMPGRTVWEQTVFGVDAIPARAAWWLTTLQLEGLADRMPEQLSGGQRQRVSLARALAGDPRVVLLDEPFSALDAPVRQELRREMRRLQREVNLSTIIVTHDPEEAAMLADEIMVVSDGRVLQSGPCRDVYQRPSSVEVGRLLGMDNLFQGVASDPGMPRFARHTREFAPGTPILWHLPPEALRVRAGSPSIRQSAANVEIGLGQVVDIIDLGRSIEVVVKLASGDLVRIRSAEQSNLDEGSRCWLEIDEEALSVWEMPAATEFDSALEPSRV
jgi:ABC-type sulfate/molybdate transport systems ATPase subunit/ABC-type sulfate transport system permease component